MRLGQTTMFWKLGSSIFMADKEYINCSSTSPLLIAIDATMLAPGGGMSGLINYLREWSNRDDVEVLVLVSRDKVLERVAVDCPDVRVILWGSKLPSSIRFIWRQLFLARVLGAANVKVIFTTNSSLKFTRIPQVVHHRNVLWFLSKEKSAELASNISALRRAAWRRSAIASRNLAAANVFVSEYLRSLCYSGETSPENSHACPAVCFR